MDRVSHLSCHCLQYQNNKFTQIWLEHLLPAPHGWVSFSATRCSASRTHFSGPHNFSRQICIDFFSTQFTIRTPNIGQTMISGSLVHFLIWHTRNPRWASSWGRLRFHLTCHRGHLRFSEQIRYGASIMRCSQTSPADTNTLQPGTVCSGTETKPASHTSRQRKCRQCCPHWRRPGNTGQRSSASAASDKLSHVDDRQSQNILLRQVADMFPDSKKLL